MLKATSRIGLTAHLGIFILLIASPSYAMDNIEVHLRILGKGVVDISEVAAHCDEDYQEIENVPAQTYYWEEGAALLQATGTDPGDGNGPYQFVAWYIRPSGPVLCTNALMATIAYASQDVMEVDCIFARPRILNTTSPDELNPRVFPIKSYDSVYAPPRPSMPIVEFELTPDLTLTSIDYIDLVAYQVQIGEHFEINGQPRYRTLYFPDLRSPLAPTSIYSGDTVLDSPVRSNLSFTNTATISSDLTLDGNVGWGTSFYGVGGGYPRHVTTSCNLYLSQTNPSRACQMVTCETRVSDDEECNDELFRIVGEQPKNTQQDPHIDTFIDTLEFAYHPTSENPTHYKLMEGGDEAELDGASPVVFNLIEVTHRIEITQGVYDAEEKPESPQGTHLVLSPLYLTEQVRLMLKKMHRQESSTRQFYFAATKIGSNWASQEGYPLWENSHWVCMNVNCRCPGHEVPPRPTGLPHTQSIKPMEDENWIECPDCHGDSWAQYGTAGLGLYQLTVPNYKTRGTIWNWQKNVIKACDLMLGYFGQASARLDSPPGCQPESAPPVLTGEGQNVFLPGLDDDGYFDLNNDGQYDALFTIHVMRRLNAFAKFNSTTPDTTRYHWWNTTGPTCALGALSNISGATVEVVRLCNGLTPNDAVHQVDFNLENVVHGATTATTATLHGYTESPRTVYLEEKPSGVSGTFSWDIDAHESDDFKSTIDDPDQGQSDDYQQWFRLCLWTADTLSASAQIYDSSITGTDGSNAGFRPPSGRWVKRGYVTYTGAGAQGNSGWRDYNTDGIADVDGDPFGLADGTGGDNVGAANRNTRYADNAEMRTDNH